jgi:hypothetical protein
MFQRQSRGLLLDVFEDNYLREAHLASLVFGTTLREWIAGAPERGIVCDLGRGLYRWTLRHDDVGLIAKSLSSQGLLIAGSTGLE